MCSFLCVFFASCQQQQVSCPLILLIFQAVTCLPSNKILVRDQQVSAPSKLPLGASPTERISMEKYMSSSECSECLNCHSKFVQRTTHWRISKVRKKAWGNKSLLLHPCHLSSEKSVSKAVLLEMACDSEPGSNSKT